MREVVERLGEERGHLSDLVRGCGVLGRSGPSTAVSNLVAAWSE